MAKLSDEELATLKKLREKEKAPDTPSPSVNFSLDLASDTAWERAQQLGIVPKPEANGDGEGEGEEEETPKRRGYFGDE